MKTFTMPEMDIQKFEVEDVITTSLKEDETERD